MSAGRNCRRKPAVSRDRFFDGRLAKLKGHRFRPFDAGHWGLAVDGNELPGIAVHEQGEFEQAPGKGASFAAVFSNVPGWAQSQSGRSDDLRPLGIEKPPLSAGGWNRRR
jgi:hypothetical protein